MVELKSIGLTDYYFKELILKRRDYLVLILNGICNLNLKESEIEISDTEENKKTVAKTLYEMGMDKANIAKAIHIDIKDIDKYLE